MSDKNPVNIYSGTSGLVLPVPNKLAYPEEFRDLSRLSYYSTLFNSIEVNSSFKKIPMTRTVERWSSEVRDGFRFTFKMPAIVTHEKNLSFKQRDVQSFIEVINGVGHKKGSLLIQFPGKLDISALGQLKKLIKTVAGADPEKQWKTAIEFRHHSWYQPRIYKLLEEYQMVIVIQDREPCTPVETLTHPPFIYLRFHGPEKGYRGSYTDESLRAHVSTIKRWTAEKKTVFIYFNNTLGAAVHNLMTLNSILGSKQDR